MLHNGEKKKSCFAEQSMLPTENLGFVIILITIAGYFSNWLNWKFLNYPITHLSYYLGTLVHETSHAIFCVLTGARIHEFSVFSSKPHVTYEKPRIPFLGSILINIAPIIGGLGVLYLMNAYVLTDHFALPAYANWRDIASGAWKLLSQVNLGEWQSWALIAFFLNVGAMIGPSIRDLRNIWVPIILLCFVEWPQLASLGLFAVSLILVNIAIQIIAIGGLALVRSALGAFRSS
jgi:hypothetical protein